MSELNNIGIRVESETWQTGNRLPLLHEIRHALSQLLETGQECVIDLQSLPIASAEEAQLLAALGNGEVEVQLNALGKSNIHETGLAGVWLVEHFNMDGQLVGKFIEITAIPAILKSQPEDIREGLEKLTDQLK